MAYEPTDVAQQALDAAGIEYTLGNIEDGTRPAQVTLRAYERCLRQLLRAAHWNFARKTVRLTLLWTCSPLGTRITRALVVAGLLGLGLLYETAVRGAELVFEHGVGGLPGASH